MKQDHKKPTQSEIENYITKARILRNATIVSLAKSLFVLPAQTLKAITVRLSANRQIGSSNS